MSALFIMLWVIFYLGPWFWFKGERGLLKASTWEVMTKRGLWHVIVLLQVYLYGAYTPEYNFVLFFKYLPSLGTLPDWLSCYLKWNLASGYLGQVIPAATFRTLLEESERKPLRIALGRNVPFQERLVHTWTAAEAARLGKQNYRIWPDFTLRTLSLKPGMRIWSYACCCREAHKLAGLPYHVFPGYDTACCIILEEAIGEFAVAHRGAREIQTQEFLSMLDTAVQERLVITVWTKDAFHWRGESGRTVYSVCLCHPMSCSGMKAVLEYGVPMTMPSGGIPEVSEDCAGCARCVVTCPLPQKAARLIAAKPTFDPVACLGCGLCVRHCPAKALRLVKNPDFMGIPVWDLI